MLYTTKRSENNTAELVFLKHFIVYIFWSLDGFKLRKSFARNAYKRTVEVNEKMTSISAPENGTKFTGS